jgi:hypothetical protein
MTILPVIAILLAAAPDEVKAIQDVQASHIAADAPSPTDFDRFLRRDLEAYFSQERHLKNPKVDFEMLRDGPTQSGVAYPKYYVWVRINGGKSPANRGAARVAAIDRVKFEVTMFVSEAEIRANTAALKFVFPGPVCERIEAKLGIQK